ncbi:MAG: hypothetical protein CVU14_10555, partial [Bacteroidetes bacterium HGW-Bacteroidetes-9]
MIRLKHIILSILLAVAFGAAGQTYVIDSVCVGSERHYRIDGEENSTYSWILTDPVGTITNLPETADTITVIWNMAAGEYILSVLQTSIHGCDSLELGIIRVFDLPQAYAGENISLCNSNPYSLIDATASEYMSLQWTSNGDGTFDNSTALNPTYSFGPNDISLGSLTLTLTASGFGRDGSCLPAESSITITINNLITDIAITPASCNGVSDGSVAFTASGGTEPYTFTLDGNSNGNGMFAGIAAGIYTYTISDAAGCEITGEAIVTSPELITATVTQLNINCFGASNGEIEISGITGGSGNYEYRINGGMWQSELIFTGLGSGNYTVDARDVNALACVVTLENITITEPAILAATVNFTNETFTGANDGTITVSAPSGGSGNYEFSIDGTTWQASGNFTNLTPGSYEVFIRDANAVDCFISLTTVEILAGGSLTA